MSSSFGKKIAVGSFWLIALRVVSQVISFGRIIILSRILAPNDFGLFGIVLLTLSLFEVFTQPGLNLALVQRRGDIKTYQDSVWSVNACRGAGLCVLSLVSAPVVARFFGAPEATALLQFIGVSALLRGLMSLGPVFFLRDIDFSKQFLNNGLGIFTDAIVTISLAFFLSNTWALVIGFVAGDLVRVIVSYLIHPYRPTFCLNATLIKELRKYGKWIYFSTMLIFFIVSGDSMIVGKLLGVTALGYYQMAFRIANIATTEVANVLSQLTFPVYAKIQSEMEEVRSAFLKTVQIVLVASLAIVSIIFLLGREFVELFLGPKWLPIMPSMYVLSVAGFFRALAATTTPVFRGMGKPALETNLQITRFITMVVLFYPATIIWGITGMSLVVCVSSALWAVTSITRLARELELPICLLIKSTPLIQTSRYPRDEPR